MKILAIECSAVPSSAAVLEDGKLLSEFYCNISLTHSQTLMPMIDSTLKAAGLDITDIDGLCISGGPGSFTGVRIGISTLKGLAAAANIPSVSVSSLEAMALNAEVFDGLIASVMDARCKQCYCALFISKDSKIERISNDMALSMEEFCDKIIKEMSNYGKKCILVGDGAQLFKDTAAKDADDIILAPYCSRFQSARYVAKLSVDHFLAGDTVSADALMPTYLRLPQAQRELNKKMEAQK